MGFSKFTIARIGGYLVFWLRLGSRTLPLAIPLRKGLFYLESLGRVISIGEGSIRAIKEGSKGSIRAIKNVIQEEAPVNVWKARQAKIAKKMTSIGIDPNVSQHELLHAGMGVVQSMEITPDQWGYHVTVVYQVPVSALYQPSPGTQPLTATESFFITADQLQALMINAQFCLEEKEGNSLMLKSDFTNKQFKDFPPGPGPSSGGGTAMASISMSLRHGIPTQGVPAKNPFFVQTQKLNPKMGVTAGGILLVFLIVGNALFQKLKKNFVKDS